MSDALTDLRLVNAVRRRSFVLPREHGAWGILLVPLSTGATIGLLRGGDAVPLVAFLLAAISLFCLAPG
ncbi:MAG TPA: YwiC-like family protein [Terriglobales bacterium]|nr:YwiC-like family protein [Terriglobales bacterium]